MQNEQEAPHEEEQPDIRDRQRVVIISINHLNLVIDKPNESYVNDKIVLFIKYINIQD